MSTYSDTGAIRAARSGTASERIPRRIIAGGTSAERKTAERGNYMNKLGFMATFVTGGALLAILAGALAFMMGNVHFAIRYEACGDKRQSYPDLRR